MTLSYGIRVSLRICYSQIRPTGVVNADGSRILLSAWSNHSTWRRRPSKMSVKLGIPLSRSEFEILLGDLFEHRDVEREISDKALQKSILRFKFLQPFGVAARQSFSVVVLYATVLGPPAEPGRLGDFELPTDFGHVLALIE